MTFTRQRDIGLSKLMTSNLVPTKELSMILLTLTMYMICPSLRSKVLKGSLVLLFLIKKVQKQSLTAKRQSFMLACYLLRGKITFFTGMCATC